MERERDREIVKGGEYEAQSLKYNKRDRESVREIRSQKTGKERQSSHSAMRSDDPEREREILKSMYLSEFVNQTETEWRKTHKR